MAQIASNRFLDAPQEERMSDEYYKRWFLDPNNRKPQPPPKTVSVRIPPPPPFEDSTRADQANKQAVKDWLADNSRIKEMHYWSITGDHCDRSYHSYPNEIIMVAVITDIKKRTGRYSMVDRTKHLILKTGTNLMDLANPEFRYNRDGKHQIFRQEGFPVHETKALFHEKDYKLANRPGTSDEWEALHNTLYEYYIRLFM